MKIKKRIYLYIVCAIAFVFFMKLLINSREPKIVNGQSLMERSQDWNFMIANYVNMNSIGVINDGNAQSIKSGDIYMDEHRNLLVSYKVLTGMINCATNRYFNTLLVVEKGNNRLIFTAGSKLVSINGNDTEMGVASTIIDGVIYVPFRVICENFNYEYQWDYEKNSIIISNTKPNEKIYPSSYDYRVDGKVSTVKNQANLGTCWAFASLTAVSSSLFPEKKLDFSVDHLCHKSGYYIGDGGEYSMAMAYLASWKGPVLEELDPYGDGFSPEGLNPEVHVQEMQIIESKDYNEIKKAVFLYGGVESSLYMSTSDTAGYSSAFYNAEKNAYCYVGVEKSNHDVVIIGWDDSYPASNFLIAPEKDGAFLCVNSWGEQFGDEGYFYVSYYDSNIGIHNIVYTSVEDVNNYDNIYQSDELGWVGQIGYGREDAYFSNVYTAEKDELLSAVGFYATGIDTEYEIYCIEKFKDVSSFNSKSLAAKGSLDNAGYYTIKLDKEYKMKTNTPFAVVVYIKTPNSVHPIAIEYKSEVAVNAVIDDGEGYISPTGNKWERVETTQNCNVCLKFYTKNEEN